MSDAEAKAQHARDQLARLEEVLGAKAFGTYQRPPTQMSPARPVTVSLSAEEAEALLWAVRNLSLESVRSSPYHGSYDQACGHGALSSATNRLEASLGEYLSVMSPEEL